MSDFTASNGIPVSSDEAGLISFGNTELLYAPEAEALREFLQAEADERLGRWRWPENPDYVVYLRENGSVTVFEESMPTAALTFWRGLSATGTWSGKYMAAARAYFDAHPEPKPWHDAQIGETWVLLGAHLGIAVSVVGGKDERWFTRATVFGKVERFELADPSITDARRIWPEVAA